MISGKLKKPDKKATYANKPMKLPVESGYSYELPKAKKPKKKK